MDKILLLTEAIRIANISHYGQVDKGGQPYILHPLRVMLCLNTIEEKIVGVLHDVIEDTDMTYKSLMTEGFQGETEILEAIQSVTRNKDESYSEFILRAKANKIGKMVKIADLKDNMNLDRIPDPTEKDFKRLEKYEKALNVLMDNFLCE